MRRLKILIWHVHGSYLNALGALDHEWVLPLMPGSHGGRGAAFAGHRSMREVPADEVAGLDLDLVVYQTSANYQEHGPAILSDAQRRLPAIYLEHNTPRPHPTDSRHVVDDPRTLLVHVTHYNRLMWDCGRTPTMVIEHSVAIDPDARYTGALERGITVINGLQRRPRLAGMDIFLQLRERAPLTCAGMETEKLGGLGDMPYRELHRAMAEHRFLLSPAWVGGANVLYDRAKLDRVGGFSWWERLPPAHAGEEVVVQFLLLRAFGGCGVLPSGTYHLGLPTNVPDRQRNATELFGALIEEFDVHPAGLVEPLPVLDVLRALRDGSG